MYCELLFALLVLLIDTPLSLSVGYHSQVYSPFYPIKFEKRASLSRARFFGKVGSVCPCSNESGELAKEPLDTLVLAPSNRSYSVPPPTTPLLLDALAPFTHLYRKHPAVESRMTAATIRTHAHVPKTAPGTYATSSLHIVEVRLWLFTEANLKR